MGFFSNLGDVLSGKIYSGWILFARVLTRKPEVATPSTGSKSLLSGLVFVSLGLSGIIYFIVIGEIEDPKKLFFSITGLFIGGVIIFYSLYTAPQRKKALELYEKQFVTGKFGKPAPEEKTEPDLKIMDKNNLTKIENNEQIKETGKVVEKKFNKASIIGFVLSIIAVFGIGLSGIAGLILGIIALTQIKYTHEKGKWLAIAAIVVGFIWSFVIGILRRLVESGF